MRSETRFDQLQRFAHIAPSSGDVEKPYVTLFATQNNFATLSLTPSDRITFQNGARVPSGMRHEAGTRRPAQRCSVLFLLLLYWQTYFDYYLNSYHLTVLLSGVCHSQGYACEQIQYIFTPTPIGTSISLQYTGAGHITFTGRH